jgi:hypothetical protein
MYRLFLVWLPSIESVSFAADLIQPIQIHVTNPLLGITEAFKADKFEKKINLGTVPFYTFERSLLQGLPFPLSLLSSGLFPMICDNAC